MGYAAIATAICGENVTNVSFPRIYAAPFVSIVVAPYPINLLWYRGEKYISDNQASFFGFRD